jgi:glycerol-3-phosphate dehydrogenase
MEIADEKYDMAKQILKSPVYFKKLFYRYGSEIEKITERAYENWNKTKNSNYSWLKAEIEYSVENEFCKNANDFINCRTELWMEADNCRVIEIEQIFNELSE